MPPLITRRRFGGSLLVSILLLVGIVLGIIVARSYFTPVSVDEPALKVEPESAPPIVPDDLPAAEILLVDVTEASGIRFRHDAGTLERYFFPSIMTGGGALFDFDRDGDLDIYLINGNQHEAEAGQSAVSAGSMNRLYRQTKEWQFEDVTARSGLGDTGFGMGVAVGDVNNDGYPDVYVSNFGADRLYLNRQDGTFEDVTAASGIENLQWGTSVSLVDYDRDGWLDVFVTNYVDYYATRVCADSDGRADFCGPQAFFETSDRLFRNRSADSSPTQVRFEDVSVPSGVSSQLGAGLGVVCADFDGDHWPDIYVANDRKPNFLWINQHDGTFVDEAVFRGAAYDSQGRPQASMGIAAGDLNGDSAIDLYVTHLEGESNALYLSEGHAGFTERSAAAKLLTPSYPSTGFGTTFVDLNHDDRLDILVVNGRVKRSEYGANQGGAEQVSQWSEYAEANQIFLNAGQGRFREHGRGQAQAEDSFCGPVEISRGLATGDIDNDGDLDVLVTNIAGLPRVYRNDAAKSGGWLRVRAVDPQFGGRDAYGSVVTLIADAKRWTRTINPGVGYLSSSEPTAHFGLGDRKQIGRIEVTWPNGVTETFSGGPVNQLRILQRGAGESTDGIAGQ